MDAPQSYSIGYKPSHIQHHTTRTAENSSQYILPHLTKLAQSKPNLKLLDVGAGPGTISASLARYIPQGIVTATDISEDVLQQAKNHAKEVGCENIEFQVANAYSLPFPDDSFDIVHVSQVIGHLSDPVRGLKEILRVCVPGGIVGTRDADMRSWVMYPDLPGLRDFFDLLGGLMPRRDTGLSLISLALKAGVRRSDIQFTTSTYAHVTDVERQALGRAFRERAKDGDTRRRGIEEGLRIAEAMDEMVKAWDLWIDTEDAVSACICGEIIISKAT
ncbi:S-adenosyl-L-methionine-dependent methyltransferase [Panaeolus papilionaceus]|nr:S-adenosyl-L-methionine-dependent methyltransferase [Panaeolus papilionaceus]